MLRTTLLVVACLTTFTASSVTAAEINYETEVRPLLKAHCFHCHGEEKEVSGGLDLRLKRLMLRGGESGPSIVPGHSDESLLIDYVESGLMPPKEEENLTAAQIEILKKWIDAGAPLTEAEQENDPAPGEFIVTASERNHWAYQPIQRPQVPEVAGNTSKNPIDAFIAQKLVANQLGFSPEASRRTLIRRATFDLLGLLPTPEEVASFVHDESPDAYEKLIDRLLASPHYGERWGRHWLDAAGYADSEGADDRDVIRDDAWGYRDYVIRSLNADKPWNQFIVEQIAGDELVGVTQPNAQGLARQNPEVLEAVTATGFLRMVPDGTASNPMDPVLARNVVLTETIKVISSSLLATTVACAECHHHRFDPVPQDDFYRLRAVLAPVYNVNEWRVPNLRKLSILSAEEQVKFNEIEAQAKEIDQARNTRIEEVVNIVFERVLETIPEEDREQAKAVFQTAVKDRTPEQKQFVTEKYPNVGLLSRNTLHLFLNRYEDGKELEKSYKDLTDQALELRKTRPAPRMIRVANEIPDKVPDTYLFHRGDHTSPVGDPIAPGGLALFASLEKQLAEQPVENTKPLKTSGRRLAYARFLTSGQHPLVARVLVNRFWHHHFGRGIVDSLGDFGTQGSLPTHPELLDWLSAEFMEQGWSLKQMHRLIMTSQTYKQSSLKNEQGVAVDYDNRLLWRMPIQRREAEAVRDGILYVTGELNPEMFGPPVPVAPTKAGIMAVGGGTISEDRKELKRTIYTQVRRTTPVSMLQAFDAPQMEPNCEKRIVSTVATQSLSLMNSDFVVQQSEAFAKRILDKPETASTPETQLTAAWQLAFSRDPRAEELQMGLDYLKAQTETFTQSKAKEPAVSSLASLCQILLCSNEFLYVE